MILSLLVLSCSGPPRGPQSVSPVPLDTDPTLGLREACEVSLEAVTCPREAVREHMHGVVSLWELAMAQARELEAEKALRDVDVSEALADRDRAQGAQDRAELQRWVWGAAGLVIGILGGIALSRE